MIVDVEVQVDRPLKQVFDAMADARNEPTWNSQVSRTELVTAPPIGQGTTFTTVNRGQEYQAVITTYEEPSHLVFTVTGKTMVITGDLTFAAAGETSTRLTGRFDMQPQGFMKMMLPLMAPAVRRDFPKQMASFKAFCESQP